MKIFNDKRYTAITEGIVDNEFKELIVPEDIVGLLNKLDTEKRVLEKEHSMLKSQLKSSYDRIRELEREVEELKCEVGLSREDKLVVLLENQNAILMEVNTNLKYLR